MTELEVKAVVNDTVDKLLKDNMIKYSDLIIYERMSDRLREHFKKPDQEILTALNLLRDHPYLRVLKLYYRDNLTLEQIAEILDVDVSTVVRNKKSLCIRIFNIIN